MQFKNVRQSFDFSNKFNYLQLTYSFYSNGIDISLCVSKDILRSQ